MNHKTLQTLIKLRQRQVDIAAAELAEVQLAVEQLAEQLRQVEAEIEINRGQRLGQSALSIPDLREAGRWSLQLAATRQAIEGKQQILDGETQRRRERLSAARRQLRTVELLQEHAAAEANELAAAQLQSRLDEWSISRTWRETQT